MIKSDHSGIESSDDFEALEECIQKIKSDHSGIERSYAETDTCVFKVEIKSDHSGIESFVFYNYFFYHAGDKIRP